MNKKGVKKYLDNTIAFTQSSYTYKDPYNVNGNIIYQMKNKVQSFVAWRSMENEFADFKSYYINDQLREIYDDLYKSYRRYDKVILNRSMSESMKEYTISLLEAKKPNPFRQNIEGIKLL